MESTQVVYTPSYWITVFQSAEGGWNAIGSRKTSDITIQRKTEFDSFDWDYGYADKILPIVQDFTFEGHMRGFTFTTGTTPLAALGSLLDAFKEEEKREEEEERQRAKIEKKNKKRIKKMKKDVNAANGLDWEDF